MKKNGIGEIFRQRELIFELTKRQLTLAHKGSFLGFIWVVLNPLLALGLYFLVFGFIFNAKFDGEESRLDYALGIFLGLSVVHFLTEILAASPQVMHTHSNYVKRSTIPIQVIPVSTLLTAVFHLTVSGSLVLIGHIVAGGRFSVQTLWVFPIGLCLFCMGLGLSWLLACLGALFKDVSQIAPPMSLAILFGSAVFYPVDQVPESIWRFLRFNPILHAINELRSALFLQNEISIYALLYLFFWSISCLIVGWYVFYFTKSKLAEMV